MAPWLTCKWLLALASFATWQACSAEPTCKELRTCPLDTNGADASPEASDLDGNQIPDNADSAATNPEERSSVPDADSSLEADDHASTADADASACAPSPTPARCSSNTPQFCNAAGQWQDVSTGPCPGASTCSN